MSKLCCTWKVRKDHNVFGRIWKLKTGLTSFCCQQTWTQNNSQAKNVFDWLMDRKLLSCAVLFVVFIVFIYILNYFLGLAFI